MGFMSFIVLLMSWLFSVLFELDPTWCIMLSAGSIVIAVGTLCVRAERNKGHSFMFALVTIVLGTLSTFVNALILYGVIR